MLSNGIQTWVVRAERELADHLTTSNYNNTNTQPNYLPR